MNLESKKALMERLKKDIEIEENKNSKQEFQDTYFDNPFNTCSPAVIQVKILLSINNYQLKHCNQKKVL